MSIGRMWKFGDDINPGLTLPGSPAPTLDKISRR
jgi:hypothetical protein